MPEFELTESWTVRWTADYLDVTGRSVRRMLADGVLSGYKVPGKTGQEWRVYADSVEAYLQRKRADSRTGIVRMSDRAELDKSLDAMSELTGITEAAVKGQVALLEAIARLSVRLESLEDTIREWSLPPARTEPQEQPRPSWWRRLIRRGS